MKRFEYCATPILGVLLISSACKQRPTALPTRPDQVQFQSPPPAAPPPAVTPSVATYSVAFTASPACAAELPEAGRVRTYTATLYESGAIQWSGPTLQSPPGHQPISAGTQSGDVLSFSIDVEHDPQTDAFNGLWDNMGSGTFLTIAGKGNGTVNNAEIAGTFDGTIAFLELVPSPKVFIVHYFGARDHGFKFLKQ
jgi:hypothetical protein